MNDVKKIGSDVVLLFILLLAAFLYGFGIWNDHYVNTYYTTAVGSMLQSFHNFFFASLDSAGSVTVDKPPVTFWIQTLSAWIFGLHGWSVILPQALAGVGSVLLVYLLVKPSFGKAAARLAALAMATTPVAAAVSRTNNIDAMLVFTLLLAAWFLFKGTRQHTTGSLLTAFGLIGVAFNEKMLQAYMVVPAFYLFYILAAKVNWKKKTGVLAACTAVLLIISLSWAVIVDSIPADKRPYMGSSGTNSVLNLAFGYNGVSRLTGDRSTGGGSGMPGGGGFGGGQMPGMNGELPAMDGAGGQGSPDGQGQGSDDGVRGQQGTDSGARSGDGGAASRGQQGTGAEDGGGMPPAQGGGQGAEEGGMPGTRPDGGSRQFGGADGGQGGRGGMNGGGGGMFNTGTAGPLRLFQQELSGQASWLLPFVLFGVIGIFASLRRRHFTMQHKEALFWLAWLVPAIGFFSIAGFFHQYYLIMMAPPVAALAGAGWIKLWHYYKERSGWLSWLLPAAVPATAAFQWYIIRPYDSTIGSGWSIGVLAAGLAAALLLIVLRILKGRGKPALVHAAAVAGLLVLLIGPLYWAFTPITYGLNSMTPAAGPDSSDSGGFGGGGRNTSTGVNGELLAYLKEHNTGEEYLFAAMDYGTAGPYIIDEGEKVVILNGFNNSDVPYTTDTLQALVESGKVKYFLVTSGGMGGGRGGNSGITSWITENGTEVPSADWQGTVTGGAGGTGGTLYEVHLN
ncbi:MULTISPECIES: glycosyltransferase family 39 protein [unclassified Paenibacillus]|uniref:ArnT family glycosyltransferase n=1 Tax=unclassified Paenibacillus TaxID=185978 RepID=UPI0024051B68|nr:MULTISPECIES: glycosyltransferase family 39 protein [unclassified Paenibacillus]MDF9843347.1 4-amino-4-deoxy-L-arabinose transferase-like glycosyltransferase [Paenibacillus sp. PastF-2]MDF9849935.1 4-amino-4-deoxy-L-arabinose transferase-like glycosyltransferase [Paenibacillus sp. PastM-2]MDF9856643.1 4-amino-4-deoxy-L-arabinose transferase-like glycosyltransferase [Paenibacillus sp. PastF-1]MDH6481912.1 4-amino-4-deoxy-L-arabinose transferase-like glycosyltransferase [Paenibacillus sp. Past